MTGYFRLDELANKLFSILPDNLQQLDKEIQQQFKQVLQTAFSHMDLITREEFDIQTKVLARTREKVAMLEKQVESLTAKKSKKK